jgi:hypothetical protein
MKHIILRILIFSVVSLLFSLQYTHQASAASQDPTFIQGNKLIDVNGNQVPLRGASLWELEFGCKPSGHYQTSTAPRKSPASCAILMTL